MHNYGPTNRRLYYAGTGLGEIGYEYNIVRCHFPLSKPKYRAW